MRYGKPDKIREQIVVGKKKVEKRVRNAHFISVKQNLALTVQIVRLEDKKKGWCRWNFLEEFISKLTSPHRFFVLCVLQKQDFTPLNKMHFSCVSRHDKAMFAGSVARCCALAPKFYFHENLTWPKLISYNFLVTFHFHSFPRNCVATLACRWCQKKRVKHAISGISIINDNSSKVSTFLKKSPLQSTFNFTIKCWFRKRTSL